MSSLVVKPSRQSCLFTTTGRRLNASIRQSSTSSSAYSRTKGSSKVLRLARRSAYLGAGIGLVYVVDKLWLASSLTRSARTFATRIIIASDYKINFRSHPPFATSIAQVHGRNAERIYNLLRVNGGLYLKIGQAIAMQSAVLPPEFQARFARMFDDAPQNSWTDVENVIREEFGGRSPEDVFGTIEKTARASASVAQVHWARLPDGREVAVKVQKREIKQQVGWDLWAFKVVMYAYTKLFDLPLYGMVPFISERLLLETDFVNEADNAERMKSLVETEPRLRGKVYIPRVERALSTKRVMTAEWIEGVRLWDKGTMTAPWKGGKGHGTPGCHGEPLERNADAHDQLQDQKPERLAWKGPTGDGGLGVQLKDVMSTMIDLFSAQMFVWGWVHCDPHPGNILIRHIPSSTGSHPELVLLDHGLYVHLPRTLRLEYAELWRALLSLDMKAVRRIAGGWGVMDEDADVFGSAVLLRPYGSARTQLASALRSLSPSSPSSPSTHLPDPLIEMDEGERAYRMQEGARQTIRRIFGGMEGKDGEKGKWPLELIFVGRALRIVQANNQYLGSPVNRVKMTSLWAARALTRAEAGLELDDMSPSKELAARRNSSLGMVSRILGRWDRVLRAFGHELIFRISIFSSDMFFWITRFRQWTGTGGGMEDELEQHMKGVASGLGVQLHSAVFEG